MASLLDLLSSYPVLENLVSVLPLGDLFNLSKTNSLIRAALHGFQLTRSNGKRRFVTSVRPSLCIGRHDTPFWKNLKAKSLLLCSESQHTRGQIIRGCLMCSMPVCEACIIKASFGKRDEKTFQHRTRSLCPDCFDSETPHIEQTLHDMKAKIRLHSPSITGLTCICTAKDGHLCLKCKTEQKSDLDAKLCRCYGEGCLRTKEGGFSNRVCLWCDLCLPSERSRAEARREYDQRHILARSHSSYEHHSEDEIIVPAEQEAIWRAEEERFRELRAISARRQSTAEAAEDERWRQSEAFRRVDSTFLPPASLAQQQQARLCKLERVTQQRWVTAEAAEDERWRRAELLRRSNSMFYPPSLLPSSNTDSTRGSSLRSRLHSTASTLVERDQTLPPNYESCSGDPISEEKPEYSHSQF